jgi:adenylate cyclase
MPVLRELKAQGLTDYLAHVIYLSGQRNAVSWATDHTEGFSEEQLRTLRQLMPYLALRLELESTRYSLGSLLEVYLGENAARRVLAGAFKRGSGERIQAAIWLCDLRGFTTLADQVPAEQVVSTLDAYFDQVVGAVAAQGGEVLKFIGDAILAIFRVQEGAEQQACAAALVAAQDALGRLATLNDERAREGLPSLAMGVALHLGQVMYGNIGSKERLDFTVIGASVNEASRLESLCKQLGTPLVMSGQFARACGSADVVPLGRHSLRGVREEREVFGLAPLLP